MRLREFGIKARESDVAVVYYAGHGVQVARENYLLPADAQLERERDLVYEALPLELFLGEISQARKLGMILLDACRNNPFVDRLSRSMTVASRGPARAGLARVDNVPRNTLVAMATKADQTAEDGSDGHSPFAAGAARRTCRPPGPGTQPVLPQRARRRAEADEQPRRSLTSSARSAPTRSTSTRAHPIGRRGSAAIAPLEVRDNAAPTPLSIPKPTDPDQDPLTVRVTGLPRSGEVRIEGRLVTPGAVYSVERFATATYKPTGSAVGEVGTVDILVEDGRGGSVMGSLPISRRRLQSRRRWSRRVAACGSTRAPSASPPPTDPDGDD